MDEAAARGVKRARSGSCDTRGEARGETSACDAASLSTAAATGNQMHGDVARGHTVVCASVRAPELPVASGSTADMAIGSRPAGSRPAESGPSACRDGRSKRVRGETSMASVGVGSGGGYGSAPSQAGTAGCDERAGLAAEGGGSAAHAAGGSGARPVARSGSAAVASAPVAGAAPRPATATATAAGHMSGTAGDAAAAASSGSAAASTVASTAAAAAAAVGVTGAAAAHGTACPSQGAVAPAVDTKPDASTPGAAPQPAQPARVQVQAGASARAETGGGSGGEGGGSGGEGGGSGGEGGGGAGGDEEVARAAQLAEDERLARELQRAYEEESSIPFGRGLATDYQLAMLLQAEETQHLRSRIIRAQPRRRHQPARHDPRQRPGEQSAQHAEDPAPAPPEQRSPAGHTGEAAGRGQAGGGGGGGEGGRGEPRMGEQGMVAEGERGEEGEGREPAGRTTGGGSASGGAGGASGGAGGSHARHPSTAAMPSGSSRTLEAARLARLGMAASADRATSAAAGRTTSALRSYGRWLRREAVAETVAAAAALRSQQQRAGAAGGGVSGGGMDGMGAGMSAAEVQQELRDAAEFRALLRVDGVLPSQPARRLQPLRPQPTAPAPDQAPEQTPEDPCERRGEGANVEAVEVTEGGAGSGGERGEALRQEEGRGEEEEAEEEVEGEEEEEDEEVDEEIEMVEVDGGLGMGMGLLEGGAGEEAYMEDVDGGHEADELDAVDDVDAVNHMDDAFEFDLTTGDVGRVSHLPLRVEGVPGEGQGGLHPTAGGACLGAWQERQERDEATDVVSTAAAAEVASPPVERAAPASPSFRNLPSPPQSPYSHGPHLVGGPARGQGEWGAVDAPGNAAGSRGARAGGSIARSGSVFSFGTPADSAVSVGMAQLGGFTRASQLLTRPPPTTHSFSPAPPAASAPPAAVVAPSAVPVRSEPRGRAATALPSAAMPAGLAADSPWSLGMRARVGEGRLQAPARTRLPLRPSSRSAAIRPAGDSGGNSGSVGSTRAAALAPAIPPSSTPPPAASLPATHAVAPPLGVSPHPAGTAAQVESWQQLQQPVPRASQGAFTLRQASAAAAAAAPMEAALAGAAGAPAVAVEPSAAAAGAGGVVGGGRGEGRLGHGVAEWGEEAGDGQGRSAAGGGEGQEGMQGGAMEGNLRVGAEGEGVGEGRGEGRGGGRGQGSAEMAESDGSSAPPEAAGARAGHGRSRHGRSWHGGATRGGEDARARAAARVQARLASRASRGRASGDWEARAGRSDGVSGGRRLVGVAGGRDHARGVRAGGRGHGDEHSRPEAVGSGAGGQGSERNAAPPSQPAPPPSSHALPSTSPQPVLLPSFSAHHRLPHAWRHVGRNEGIGIGSRGGRGDGEGGEEREESGERGFLFQTGRAAAADAHDTQAHGSLATSAHNPQGVPAHDPHGVAPHSTADLPLAPHWSPLLLPSSLSPPATNPARWQVPGRREREGSGAGEGRGVGEGGGLAAARLRWREGVREMGAGGVEEWRRWREWGSVQGMGAAERAGGADESSGEVAGGAVEGGAGGWVGDGAQGEGVGQGVEGEQLRAPLDSLGVSVSLAAVADAGDAEAAEEAPAVEPRAAAAAAAAGVHPALASAALTAVHRSEAAGADAAAATTAAQGLAQEEARERRRRLQRMVEERAQMARDVVEARARAAQLLVEARARQEREAVDRRAREAREALERRLREAREAVERRARQAVERVVEGTGLVRVAAEGGNGAANNEDGVEQGGMAAAHIDPVLPGDGAAGAVGPAAGEGVGGGGAAGVGGRGEWVEARRRETVEERRARLQQRFSALTRLMLRDQAATRHMLRAPAPAGGGMPAAADNEGEDAPGGARAAAAADGAAAEVGMGGDAEGSRRGGEAERRRHMVGTWRRDRAGRSFRSAADMISDRLALWQALESGMGGVDAAFQRIAPFNRPALARNFPLAFRLAAIDRDFNESDYEMLLALDEISAPVVRLGATPEEIDRLPATAVTPQDSDLDPCAICIEVPSEGEMLRRLPCAHSFHRDCIDEWLRRRAVCPICKRDMRGTHH
ncbi:hypothetical protein CLOP_g21886 [Closterium sp. NIES-67]|nr:hypothetical protein CLOP_g21886 [Closterium sp. NIES-67]